MTSIYALNPYPVNMCQRTKMKFIHQGFLKLSCYRQTDMHIRMPAKLYTTPLRGWPLIMLDSDAAQFYRVEMRR